MNLLRLLSFSSSDRPKPISFGFQWKDGLVDDEDTVQSEYNLRCIASGLGIYYHKLDYIREKGKSGRAATLTYGGTYYYMSHH